jgi:hypothetical protein
MGKQDMEGDGFGVHCHHAQQRRRWRQGGDNDGPCTKEQGDHRDRKDDLDGERQKAQIVQVLHHQSLVQAPAEELQFVLPQ